MTKPEELQWPFPKDRPAVTIADRVFYVPESSVENAFSFPGWESEALFGNQKPICIEYCSGNGAWIAEKAAANPHFNWVAIERCFPRVRKIWSKMKNRGLDNLLIIWGEAHRVTESYLPDASVERLFINFPDPWPKRRHADQRLIQSLFLQQLHRIATRQCSLTVVTDDPICSNWTLGEIQKHGGFTSVYPEPYYVTHMLEYGTSYFEELWRGKGRDIRYHQFARGQGRTHIRSI